MALGVWVTGNWGVRTKGRDKRRVNECLQVEFWMESVWQICTSDGMFWPPQQGEPQDQICYIWLLSVDPDKWG